MYHSGQGRNTGKLGCTLFLYSTRDFSPPRQSRDEARSYQCFEGYVSNRLDLQLRQKTGGLRSQARYILPYFRALHNPKNTGMLG